MTIGQRAKQGFLHLPPSIQRQVLHRLGRYAPWETGFDFTPPEPAAGEEVGPPDFVGVGVQKAGTTWWYEMLLGHPDVADPPGLHKERHFFDRFGALPFGPVDIDRYHRWFPRRPGQVAGEWTPDYVSLPWVPEQLARAAPRVRILLLLRDPVDRFRSGLAHQARMGTAPTGSAVADALQRGFYHRDLLPWLEAFDRDRILVLQYEQCVADPHSRFRATTEFLGLAAFDPSGLDSPADRARGERSGRRGGRAAPGLDPEVTRRIREAYEPDVTALAQLVPDLDLALWPHFAYLAGGPSNSPTLRP